MKIPTLGRGHPANYENHVSRASVVNVLPILQALGESNCVNDGSDHGDAGSRNNQGNRPGQSTGAKPEAKKRNVGFGPVTHVIFDVDGTLLDTVGIYAEVLNRVLKKCDKKLSWEFYVSLLGMRREESLSKLKDHYNLPGSLHDLCEETARITLKMISKAYMMEGAERLIHHLYSHKIPMAVATSGSQATTEAKIAAHRETFSKFHHVTTGTHPDIKAGKPAPDIFLICAGLFDEKVDPAKCLVFEDAPSGVAAGVAAGMQVVAIPDKRVSPDTMRSATQVLYSMAEFKPEDFGLPGFDDA